MKPITAEWVSKAEGDFAMMEREVRARKNRSYDGICFHAQQCAEKYFKGNCSPVIPAKAGIHPAGGQYKLTRWIPTFAGMTGEQLPSRHVLRTAALDARNRCRTFRRVVRIAFGLTG